MSANSDPDQVQRRDANDDRFNPDPCAADHGRGNPDTRMVSSGVSAEFAAGRPPVGCCPDPFRIVTRQYFATYKVARYKRDQAIDAAVHLRCQRAVNELRLGAHYLQQSIRALRTAQQLVARTTEEAMDSAVMLRTSPIMGLETPELPENVIG
jgi:hypothetical protein